MELRGALPDPAAKREYVRAMFDRIAPRYDLMNRLMTLGLDRRWRRALLDSVALRPEDRLLDLATGTGDLAALAATRGARVVGVDLAPGMLALAQRRSPSVVFVRADGASLPLPDASVDVITCGFALRNFTRLEPIFDECARVLCPGGRMALLEIDEPRSRILRWGHRLHLERVVPWLGGLLSDREAYRYLPASTAYLPDEGELRALLAKTGFTRVEKRRHLLGAVQALSAVRDVA